jgi:hypothetical protein
VRRVGVGRIDGDCHSCATTQAHAGDWASGHARAFTDGRGGTHPGEQQRARENGRVARLVDVAAGHLRAARDCVRQHPSAVEVRTQMNSGGCERLRLARPASALHEGQGDKGGQGVRTVDARAVQD